MHTNVESRIFKIILSSSSSSFHFSVYMFESTFVSCLWHIVLPTTILSNKVQLKKMKITTMNLCRRTAHCSTFSLYPPLTNTHTHPSTDVKSFSLRSFRYMYFSHLLLILSFTSLSSHTHSHIFYILLFHNPLSVNHIINSSQLI